MNNIPNFAEVPLAAGDRDSSSLPDWTKAAERKAGQSLSSMAWATPEGLNVKPVFGAEDLQGLDFLETRPGMVPFLRGPYPTMYTSRPWTIRQYAGF